MMGKTIDWKFDFKIEYVPLPPEKLPAWEHGIRQIAELILKELSEEDNVCTQLSSDCSDADDHSLNP